MPTSTDTIDATDYLKGVAILSVYVNHFLNQYITQSFRGYANGLISIFFLFSGYGLFFSLKREFEEEKSGLVFHFFKKRLMRIFPLFWIWCILAKFSNGPFGFFALDFIEPKSPWFIPALLQCYLATPFLFLFLRRTNRNNGILIGTSGFVLINLLLFSLGMSPVQTIGYRDLFFLHIFIFFLGLFAAGIINIRKVPVSYAVAAILIHLFLIQETSNNQLIFFPGKSFIVPFLFSFTTFFVCFIFLGGSLKMPLKGLFTFLGRYTYSIYLFHGFGFLVLKKTGLLIKYEPSWIGISAVIIASPVFIYAYAVVEITVNEFTFGNRKLKNVFQKIREPVFMLFKTHRRQYS